MKKQHIVIIILAVVVAIGVWVAAISALNKNSEPNKVTIPNAGKQENLVTPEEFGGMDVSTNDIPVTGQQVTGFIDRLFGTDLTDKIGGNK